MYTVHQIFKTSQQFSANGISLFWFSLISMLCISKLLSDLIFFAWLYKIIFIATRYWNTIKKIARQVPCFRLLMNRHALMFLGLFGPSLVWNKRDFFLILDFGIHPVLFSAALWFLSVRNYCILHFTSIKKNTFFSARTYEKWRINSDRKFTNGYKVDFALIYWQTK